MSVKERLIKFLKYKNLGQKRFAQIVGLSYGYVNAIRVSIQPETLHKISMCFPELNIGWLITGEGEMLKSNTNVVNEEQTEYKKIDSNDDKFYREQCERLMRVIENNSVVILKQQEENERLRKELTKKDQASVAPKADAECAAVG